MLFRSCPPDLSVSNVTRPHITVNGLESVRVVVGVGRVTTSGCGDSLDVATEVVTSEGLAVGGTTVGALVFDFSDAAGVVVGGAPPPDERFQACGCDRTEQAGQRSASSAASNASSAARLESKNRVGGSTVANP